MPQKRNPVALEHARVIGSKAVGQAQAVMTAVHNTPFGDINDTEDDLQPLVFSMFKDAFRAVRIVAAALRTAEFDAATARGTRRRRLDDADRTGRYARARAGHSVQRRPRNLGAASLRRGSRIRAKPLAAILADESAQVLPAPLVYTEGALEQILSPRHFVMVRRTYGGPAPDETRRAAAVSNAKLDADQAWLDEATDALARAQQRLARESGSPMSTTPEAGAERHADDEARTSRWWFSKRSSSRRSGRSGGSTRERCRLGRPHRLSHVAHLGRPAPLDQHRQGGRLLPGEPVAAVVGGGPLGDGHADERHHHRRHHRTGLRHRTALRAVLFRPADRDDHPVAHRRAVLHACACLHRVRVPRTPLRRAGAHGHQLSLSRRPRVLARGGAGRPGGGHLDDPELEHPGDGAA